VSFSNTKGDNYKAITLGTPTRRSVMQMYE